MNYNFDFSNLFAEPVPFNLEAVPPQRGSERLDALRALGMNTGDGGDQTELLRNMMAEWARQMEANRAQEAALYAQTPRPEEYARARRYGKDPYRAAQSDVEAQRASDYGTLANYKAMNARNAAAGPGLSAAQIAMQGPSAVNQWAQLGAYKDFGVNPAEVKALTQNRRFPT
jgi:hypothetical protein